MSFFDSAGTAPAGYKVDCVNILESVRRMFSRVRKSMRATCRLIRGTPMWTRHSCGNHGPKNSSSMPVGHFLSDVVFVCHVDDTRNLSVEHVVRRHNLEKR
jgi:hypothetical protein